MPIRKFRLNASKLENHVGKLPTHQIFPQQLKVEFFWKIFEFEMVLVVKVMRLLLKIQKSRDLDRLK